MPAPLLISSVATLLGQWFTHRSEKAQAKHERQLKVITGEVDLDNTSAQDMRFSWKDEYLTLVFTSPILAIFYGAVFNNPGVIARAKEGVAAVSDLPEWYQITVLVIVAASFGVRNFLRYMRGPSQP